jgi:hypothetical protein
MKFGLDHPKPAIVAIDLHRGQLDMDVVAANKRLFNWARGAGMALFSPLTPSWRSTTSTRG